ncbi:DUF4145 domain-containing protein [Patescibacteria group bacterium]|nr:DUF4145 domain-containing protein [Patescibacteria group bacterium]
MDKEKTPNAEKIRCRHCGRITNHKILHIKEVIRDCEGIEEEQEGYTYETLQCMGCETVCLLEKYSNSFYLDENTGAPEEFVEVYPDPSHKRNVMNSLHLLPEKVRIVYEETVKAFNQNLNILAGVGLRTVVEALCADKKIKKKRLEEKIEALVEAGIMTKGEANLLHVDRLIGNKSTHKFVKTHSENLKIGLDIIENILEKEYVLPKKSTVNYDD